MTIREQIRQLASRPDSHGPFLTLYIDTNRGDGTRNDRIRLMMKKELQTVRDALGFNGQQEMVENGISRIEGWLSEQLRPETRGVVIFADPSDEFFVPIELNVPVKPQLHIGSHPHLRQLTHLHEHHPHLLLAMVDGKSARLLEIEFGTVTAEQSIEDPDVPSKTDQGGWSQANIQRHIQDHKNHHHKDVAERLTKLFDQHGGIDVVVSGQERNSANFSGYLPKRIDERIVGTLHLDMAASQEEAITASEQLVHQVRGSSVDQKLDELEAAAKKNGRGAMGLSRVIEAVNQKKLDGLLLSNVASGRGWKCTSCRTIGETVPLGCPACGSDVRTVDLVEQFIAAAHQEKASIEFVPEQTILDRYSGVGAFLRF